MPVAPAEDITDGLVLALMKPDLAKSGASVGILYEYELTMRLIKQSTSILSDSTDDKIEDYGSKNVTFGVKLTSSCMGLSLGFEQKSAYK